MLDDYYLEIAVTDPSKHPDGLGSSYINYKVNTKTNKPGFAPGECIVIRRYSDFVWLVGEFARCFPGAIAPVLPEKQTVGRFGPEFVESRRRALEKFLHRIADHLELGSSPQFVSFLQADDARLHELKDSAKSAKASITDRATGWFTGTVNSIQVPTGKVDLEKSTADMKIEEISLEILGLEKQLLQVVKHSGLLVKKSRESATTLFEFGQSLTWLGQSEGDAVGAALTQVGAAVDKLSMTATKHAEAEVRELDEPMDEYVRYIASVKAAIQQRADKKSAYISCLKDLEVKQAAYNKVLTQPGKEADASKKQDLVEKAQTAADAAKVEYENVSERLLVEYDNFKQQKAADIRNIILSFINLQIEFNRQSERAWLDLVPTLEQIAVASPSAPFTPAVAAPSAPTYSPGGFSGFGGKAGGGSQDAPAPAPAPADNPFDDRDEDELVGV